ncbi:hypothetical protein V2J09_002299 [Rumex salicifolius]
MKDPIEAAFKEYEDLAPVESVTRQDRASDSAALIGSSSMSVPTMNKEEYVGENMNVDGKLERSILSQFTEEQMSRYESFRRSKFNKAKMIRLLVSISGSQNIPVKMTIAVSICAKMFVGDLVEKARVVMIERNDSGLIRPCHIREAYRRLKIEGKLPRRSV